MKFSQFLSVRRELFWFILSLVSILLVTYYSFLVDLDPSRESSSGRGGTPEMAASTIVSLEFEVFGKVQGVFFRKYTVSKGKELGLRGWCRNTSQGSVLGAIQGPPDQILKMKHWLEKEGSPRSRIGRAEFRNEETIPDYTLSSFVVQK